MVCRNIAYQFLLNLPTINILLPIVLPTLYLWVVDTLALRRGTWVIESGTKLGWHFWEGLDIEEALFFLVTNILIVFGLVAFDNAVAIIDAFPDIFPEHHCLPSPALLIKALLLTPQAFDEERILGMRQAFQRLKSKSRSFYLASGTFQRRLRIDLILLYAFCRVADDLVDEATNPKQAKDWITKLVKYLDLEYNIEINKNSKGLHDYVQSHFPVATHAILRHLPTNHLHPSPLYDLLKGFEMDLEFASGKGPFPIQDERILELYSARVAGTVAESCLALVYHHCTDIKSKAQKLEIQSRGRLMGIALQYINIARDIAIDAANSRVYLPTAWLKEASLDPNDVLRSPDRSEIENFRQRLIAKAMEMYRDARDAIEDLPSEARAPMRVAVESYVEIGRVLQEPGYRVKAGRATVSTSRRLRVAWQAIRCG